MAELIGRTLSHYRVLERIGAGGMGEVYLAEDPRLGRRVALKILGPECAADPDRLRRFEREARSLAALAHPNIVGIHDVGEALIDGTPIHFLVMERVDGDTLRELIPSKGMEAPRFFAIAIALAEALATAHAQGIVHRDLKPGNVVVTSEGRVKVLDFGLARLLPAASDADAGELPTMTMTEQGSVLGTLPYMSPEQLRGEPADERSDIFALGAILHELATGRRPFSAESSSDLVSAILRDEPLPIDAVRPDLPHHLGRIIRRCLQKDPERRYQTAKDVCNELQDLSSEVESASTVQGIGVGRGRRPLGNRWRSLALATGVAVVVVAAVLFATMRRDQRERRPAPEPAAAEGTPPIRALAVLPFENLMHDPEQDYFVDGMQDTLITSLAKMGSLRVISRTSVARFRDTSRPLPEIARELGVQALVEGSILRAGDRVRINVQLVDGRTDQHLWADTYDRDLSHVLSLMSDVAQAVAAEIELTLTPQQKGRLAHAPEVKPAAYEAYLRGQHAFRWAERPDFQLALAQFEKSTDIDPDFALGWAATGAGHLMMGIMHGSPGEESFPAAREAASRALELDPDSALAHGVLGTVALYYDWDWATAKRETKRALELDPTDPLVRHAYADCLSALGEIAASTHQMDLAVQFDPLSPFTNASRIYHLVGAGRSDALKVAQAAARRFPNSPQVKGGLGDALWFAGKYAQALAVWEEVEGSESRELIAMRKGLETGGPSNASRARARVQQAEFEAGRARAIGVAASYAMAGDDEEAFRWLEKALARREPGMIHLRLLREFDSIRSEPRFDDILRRMGLPTGEAAQEPRGG